MTDLPSISPQFFEDYKLDRTRQKSTKNGGPYTKNDRKKRRDEVFRLHMSQGYSAVKISQILKVNRHTIDSDIAYGYSILAKDWDRGDINSWLMKQIYRLEELRAELKRLVKEKSKPASEEEITPSIKKAGLRVYLIRSLKSFINN